MKTKKICTILLALSTCLVLHQNILAQDFSDEIVTTETQALISAAILGSGDEVLRQGDELFLITTGQSSIGVMKNQANAEQTDYWYMSISRFANEAVTQSTSPNDSQGREDILQEVPQEFSLNDSYPNPFNPSTTIEFQIPVVDQAAEVSTSLRIYDMSGRLVRTLVNQNLSPGYYTELWNGLNDSGSKVSSGVYFYTLKAGDFQNRKMMTLIK